MFRGIIFDMDGVLIDSHPVHKFAWRQLFAVLGREFSEEEIDFVLDGGKRDEILTHFLGEIGRKRSSVYGRIKEEFYVSRMHQIRAVDGVLLFLADLQRARIPIAVATSATRSRTTQTLGALGMLDRFSVIVTGDEVLHGKPDPALFQKAADMLRLPNSAVIVIEDAVSGVHAARAAHMQSVGIGDGLRSKRLLEAGASVVVPNFRGLTPSILKQILTNGTSHAGLSRGAACVNSG